MPRNLAMRSTTAWTPMARLWLFCRRSFGDYNHRVFQVKRKRWDGSFMCRRCGRILQWGSNGTQI